MLPVREELLRSVLKADLMGESTARLAVARRCKAAVPEADLMCAGAGSPASQRVWKQTLLPRLQRR